MYGVGEHGESIYGCFPFGGCYFCMVVEPEFSVEMEAEPLYKPIWD
jgi:hypothetical protein